MKRNDRLRHARDTGWITNYKGKNIIKGYCRWFGVDALCAISELRALGLQIDQEHEDRIRALIESSIGDHKGKRLQRQAEVIRDEYPDSDETHAYIAGHTSGGLPFGVTWEELGQRSSWHPNNTEPGE